MFSRKMIGVDIYCADETVQKNILEGVFNMFFGDGDEHEYSQEELDNHSDQMNPNNDEYWNSRGEENQNPDR